MIDLQLYNGARFSSATRSKTTAELRLAFSISKWKIYAFVISQTLINLVFVIALRIRLGLRFRQTRELVFSDQALDRSPVEIEHRSGSPPVAAGFAQNELQVAALQLIHGGPISRNVTRRIVRSGQPAR